MPAGGGTMRRDRKTPSCSARQSHPEHHTLARMGVPDCDYFEEADEEGT
jgi:hypothetical protein